MGIKVGNWQYVCTVWGLVLVVRNQRFSEYDIGIKTAFSQSSLFLISWIKKIVKEKETIHTGKDFPNIHLPN